MTEPVVYNKIKVIHMERGRGDTDPIKFTLSNKKNKKPVDITSDTYTLTVSDEENPTGVNYLFQSTGTIADGFNGKLEFPIQILDVDLVGLKHYDVQRTYGSYIKTIIKGTINFVQDIGK